MAPQPEYWNETCLAVGVSQRHIFVKGKDTTKEEIYLKKKNWRPSGKSLEKNLFPHFTANCEKESINLQNFLQD